MTHMTVRERLIRLAGAGFLTGVTDGLFSSVLNVFFYHSTATRLFQGVASVLLGAAAFDEGTRSAAIGLAMHFGVAFGWSAVFVASRRRRGFSGCCAHAMVFGRSPRCTDRSSGQ